MQSRSLPPTQFSCSDPSFFPRLFFFRPVRTFTFPRPPLSIFLPRLSLIETQQQSQPPQGIFPIKGDLPPLEKLQHSRALRMHRGTFFFRTATFPIFQAFFFFVESPSPKTTPLLWPLSVPLSRCERSWSPWSAQKVPTYFPLFP